MLTASRRARVLAAARDSSIAFDQAAIGMTVVDLEGAFLRVNGAFCDLVGRSEADLLGRTWQTITHPDDVEPGEGEVKRVTGAGDRTFGLVKRYLHPARGVLWVLINVSLIRSSSGEPLCLFNQVVDITERRRAEEELSRLAAIVESSEDAILSKDLQGTILSWNRAAARMLGYTTSEMVGRNVTTIVPLARHAEVQWLIDTVARGQSVTNYETVRVRKDGSTVEVSITVSPVRDASRAVVGASVISRDITEQRRLIAERDATLAIVEDALRGAREAEARSRRFLSDAAHYLRNPMAGILSCAETLLRGPSADECDRLAADVVRQASHASRLVNRLLSISRLAQGELLSLVPCDVVDICRDALERAESMAPHLRFGVTAATPQPVALNRDGMTEILGCVLDNARRFAAGRIDICVARAGEMVDVRVVDDGPGLPDGALEQAFEPFVSLDHGGGPGLGLTMARALAQAHGGELTYERPAFVLRLPVWQDAYGRH